jgi:hypothetical protein
VGGFHLSRNGFANTWSWVNGGDNNLYLGYASDPTLAGNFSDKFVIQNGGNVGIGTTAPANKLEVSGSVSSDVLRISSPIASDGQYVGMTFSKDGGSRSYAAIRGGVSTYSTDLGYLSFFTTPSSNNLVEAMRINSTGNVGIGTTAPGALLQVVNTDNSTSVFSTAPQISMKNLSTTDNTYASINFQAVDLGGTTFGSGGMGAVVTSHATNNWSSDLYFYNRNTGTALAIPFVIKNSGNVGIGTTAPDLKFKVYDTSKTTASGTGNLYVSTSDSAGADLGGSIVLGGSYTGTSDTTFAHIAGRKESAISTETAGYLTLSTRPNGGSMTERFRINSTGNVGIGTTGPGAKLEVSGGSVVIDNNQSYNIRQSNGTAITTLKMTSGNVLQLVAGAGGDIQFYPNGGTGGNVTIQSSTGNVGNLHRGRTGPDERIRRILLRIAPEPGRYAGITSRRKARHKPCPGSRRIGKPMQEQCQPWTVTQFQRRVRESVCCECYLLHEDKSVSEKIWLASGLIPLKFLS